MLSSLSYRIFLITKLINTNKYFFKLTLKITAITVHRVMLTVKILDEKIIHNSEHFN